ncbi:mitochondrial 37S ribosomal protein uS9m [Lachancea thermotolerans CBS 6340]|uniref:Small ribosomal subunit protein uS9m n=1 Tax=Lachancea thermotolerans (strain ATCC 56472 / CBS 6340 / NRRL Y-8284) TaxID=559295 RepID=C5DNB6_LACTC|nr:mitochondrial 37S ribosomal protein MRPS9 [Lachancea thermotolerans CBS 6340]CAR25277.1 KLTH0G15664p [Lachancea thermotolerans CBS 6340]
MFSRLCNAARLAVSHGGRHCRNFSNYAHLSKDYTLQQTRIVPKLTTFYSANPHHEDRIDRLESLLRKYIKLPTVQMTPSEKPAWLSFSEYALIGGGTRLKPIQYQQLVNLLNRLQAIDPELINDEITSELSQYFKKTKLQSSQISIKTLDEFGRSVAVGRRKASTSKVYLVRGSGEVLVNGRQLNDYFVKMKDRESVAYPLKVVEGAGKYNAFVTTSGGGVTGQAEATMHAIAKALLVFNPLLKPRLQKAGVLTRDYRHVERKKPGKKKARKMPTWVKR